MKECRDFKSEPDNPDEGCGDKCKASNVMIRAESRGALEKSNQEIPTI